MGHQDDQDDPKKQQRQSLKPVAFAATVFSTVAITSCLVTFPLILHYVQTLESNVQLDLDFCKVSSRGSTFVEGRSNRVFGKGKVKSKVLRLPTYDLLFA